MNPVITAEGITNSASAYSSTLLFTTPGYRVNNTGGIVGGTVASYYWTSTVNGLHAWSLGIAIGSTAADYL